MLFDIERLVRKGTLRRQELNRDPRKVGKKAMPLSRHCACLV